MGQKSTGLRQKSTGTANKKRRSSPTSILTKLVQLTRLVFTICATTSTKRKYLQISSSNNVCVWFLSTKSNIDHGNAKIRFLLGVFLSLFLFYVFLLSFALFLFIFLSELLSDTPSVCPDPPSSLVPPPLYTRPPHFPLDPAWSDLPTQPWCGWRLARRRSAISCIQHLEIDACSQNGHTVPGPRVMAELMAREVQ